ncbi:MAG: hypothetical protein HZA20_13405 [Nitrospirae bacterium]|nr:hypothetical protein [Nitrospirota bacterium]
MKAFVIMPFAPDFDEIYNLFIATTLTSSGFEVFRADTILSQRNILEDVVTSITESDLIVADLTGSNPNVYYELGLAHALGKRVLLLTQSIDELPFDLRSYRVISYDTHFASIQKAKDELTAFAIGAKENTIPFGSPIKDFALPALSTSNRLADVVLAAPTDDDCELGFLDHIVGMEEGFGKLTEIMNQVGSWTESIGFKTAEAAAKVQMINANPQRGSAREVQTYARIMAEFQADYGRKLSVANAEYSATLKNVETSLEYVINANVAQSEEQRNQLSEWLELLAGIEESALTGKSGFSGMAKTLDNSPKMERMLTKAGQQTSKELKRFVANIDQTIAMISRARGIGERILRHTKFETTVDAVAEAPTADGHAVTP